MRCRVPQMWVDGFNYHYFAGRKSEGGRETYASVLVSENNRDIYAQLIVAETARDREQDGGRRRDGEGPARTGRIALYGIYFDTDKAVMKPESRPTLEQIAKLLAARSGSMSSSSATPTARGRMPTTSICRAAAPRRSPRSW